MANVKASLDRVKAYRAELAERKDALKKAHQAFESDLAEAHKYWNDDIYIETRACEDKISEQITLMTQRLNDAIMRLDKQIIIYKKDLS